MRSNIRTYITAVLPRIPGVLVLAVLSFYGSLVIGQKPAVALSRFEGESDIGSPKRSGSVQYNAASESYLVAGGGENMWSTNDSFHFVWRKVTGDVSLAAEIKILGAGGNAHRKACLMFRQTFEADSAYADAALHGNGLASLQYRETKGGRTSEIQSKVSAPSRLRLEKRGQSVSMSVARTGEELHAAGGSVRLVLTEPFYVGLAVCAHDTNALEQAVFSNLELSSVTK
jgi:TolB protein